MNPYQEIELGEARMSAAQKLSNAWDKQRAKSDASLRRTPSSIPKKEEPKKRVAEGKDPDEYDQEGDMAKGQLRTIIANAQRAHDMLKDDTNMAEWVQSKITLASDYISTVADYMQSQLKEESAICTNCEVDPCICDDSHGFVSEAAQGHTIEAHGIRGMKATPWRKTFKNHEHLSKWADANDSVEVHGTRDLEQAKKGNLSPAIREEAELDEIFADQGSGSTAKDSAEYMKRRNAAKKPGYLAPGWMLKKDPELGAKVKAKIKIGKARAKSHGDINAGKSVKEEKDYSKPINSLKDKLMAMKKELSIVQKSHTKMEKEDAKAKEKADAAPSQEDHDSALNHFKTQYLNAKRNKDDQGANDAARGYHDYSHKLSNIYQRKLKGLAIGEETNPYGDLV